jgi:hypothetical protein
MHGLDLYDYGARNYDAAIGRWGVMDSLAEKYYSVSPYVFVLIIQLGFIDTQGVDARQCVPMLNSLKDMLGNVTMVELLLRFPSSVQIYYQC